MHESTLLTLASIGALQLLFPLLTQKQGKPPTPKP